ncbi:MAG: hypothetical protein WD534_11040 [Phycisphaeraceae bacterium]
MNYIAQLRAFNHVQRALSYKDERLRQMQWRKLRPLVHHAYASIPYYRQRLDAAGVAPEDLRSLADLARLPVLTKADLQAADPQTLISRRFPRKRLAREQTSGSSGRPFVMYFDEPYRRMRKALFLRALMSCGYRPGQRLLIVTSREKRGVPAWMGWQYLSYKDPPDENVAEHNARRPRVLYGWVTPLRQMAEAARARGVTLHRPAALITTAETLDPPARRLLTEAFNCPVYEIYGLTETGTVAWQSPGWADFRISHESMIVEFLPSPEGGPAKRLVVTNLGLRSMPFIRYDTGDLATPVTRGDGAALPALERVEGRLVDCVRLVDGRVVSPFELTTAMEAVPGVSRYQILQEEGERFTVRYEPQVGVPVTPAATREAAQRAMREVMGGGIDVDVRAEVSLDPEPGRKFRVVQSQFSQQGAAG